MRALIKQRERLRGTTLYVNVSGSPLLYGQQKYFEYFNIRAFLSSVGLMNVVNKGNFDYIPINVSDIPQYFQEEKIDVALVQVTPPDAEGKVSLGISVDVTKELIKRANLVIAEVNDNLPVTEGDSKVDAHFIDFFVKSTNPLLEIKERELTDIDKQIGKNVATLIPNGATLQWGIGNIPNSVLHALKDKKDLGVHSGSITEPIIPLIQSGVITNEKKSFGRGKVLCTVLLGTKKLYDYANKNPLIHVVEAKTTHNIVNISKIDHFHAINSAIEVDLFGQVNAESIQGKTIAGVGGQMDFIKGAKLSKGGKSIIALSSTTSKGDRSKIQYSIDRVSSLKTEVDYIVTEYGIATLKHKSLRERAESLISIAHPSFREQLRNELNNRL